LVIAVDVVRSEQLDAVVAPVPASGALGNRHHLDHRDAELAQVTQFLDGGVERAFRRERADVQLVDDLSWQAHAAPLRVAPLERAGIADHGWPTHALRLNAGTRIGPRPGAVDAVLV